MSSEHGLIFLKPIFHEKIWGGRKLADKWGYDIPDGPCTSHSASTPSTSRWHRPSPARSPRPRKTA